MQIKQNVIQDKLWIIRGKMGGLGNFSSSKYSSITLPSQALPGEVVWFSFLSFRVKHQKPSIYRTTECLQVNLNQDGHICTEWDWWFIFCGDVQIMMMAITVMMNKTIILLTNKTITVLMNKMIPSICLLKILTGKAIAPWEIGQFYPWEICQKDDLLSNWQIGFILGILVRKMSFIMSDLSECKYK